MALEIKQQELARLAGVSQSLITKIERGRVVPNYDIARKIFDSLDAAKARLSAVSERKAADVMHKGLISVKSSDRVLRVAALARKHSISQFPVMERGRVVGSVTTMALVGVLPHVRVGDVAGEPFPSVGCDTPASSVRELVKKYSAVTVFGKKGALEGIITAEDLI